MDYPKQYFNDQGESVWSASFLEDYENARDDDERRAILLAHGYDHAHAAAVHRLFGLSPEELLREKIAAEIRKAEEAKAWWRKEWVPFAALVVGVATLIVSIIGVLVR